ncbi:MarR family transcriptional regulator [Robbsia andropogonis]|uniref:MarR family transcriptional regulator n=1 Tax=Robbsia andropogonis TaxID=28092 RepID=A0A0F5JZQ7_9BURK|nr:MarR family transcriptional regulator [Robbsia andropogonis]KKB63371.1 MarR family transcriptional regulator [Robbsia andropogonis]MCP1120732.1 MarR family transcriptional regulator [Robbsia andropogonis]MCP1130466.1 MarR family transcriptional regulator [Robbsia andropogonis]
MKPAAKPTRKDIGTRITPRPAQRLTYSIGNLDRLLRRHMTDALAPLGITLAQYTALSVLEARGPLSNAKVAERSFITPQSANEVMSAMATRGLIRRDADPNHGRLILLTLTAEGSAMLRRCETVFQPLELQMLDGMQDADRAVVQRWLDVLVRNLRN